MHLPSTSLDQSRTVSKQDSRFFNIFGLVLGILVAISLVLFGISRAVGSTTQRQHVREDALYIDAVANRVAPPARVAIAGQDNSAMAIVAADSGAGGGFSLPVPADAEELYAVACASCHDAGIGGAPKTGDRSAWAARIAQGNETLYRHAIEGYTGEAGVMPAKGGRADLSDELIIAGVDYLVGKSR